MPENVTGSKWKQDNSRLWAHSRIVIGTCEENKEVLISFYVNCDKDNRHRSGIKGGRFLKQRAPKMQASFFLSTSQK